MQRCRALKAVAFSAVVAAAGAPALAYVAGASDVINPSMKAWFDATQTSRADMFILGDSMVWHNADGWDAGFINALKTHTGIASSGLMQAGVEGDGYNATIPVPGPFDNSPTAVRSDRVGYLWRNYAITAGGTPAGVYNLGNQNTILSGTSGFDFKLYTLPTAAAPGNVGQFDYYARQYQSPWTPYTQTVTQKVTLPASGLNELSYHFNAVPGYQNQPMQMVIDKAQNVSFVYSRMVASGAKGASVTSWGYGGQSALSFYYDNWMGQGVTPEGRKAFFDAMTEGGSGKVNLVIEEGFNDRGEKRPSLAGSTPGNSPQAFGDNIKGLISQIRSEWVACGRNSSDLTFMLLGTYEDVYESNSDTGNNSGQLHGYSYALQQIAASDPQVSFIDMLNHGLRYTDAVAKGYMYDDVHAAVSGTTLYSEMIVDTLAAYAGVNTTGGTKWQVDAEGSWSTAANWNGSIPNGSNAIARFAESATASRTINLSVPVILGTLQLDNPNGYTIAGSTLVFSSTNGPARINVMSGAHTLAAGVRFSSATTITVPTGSRLTITGDMSSDAGVAVTKAGRGELDVKHVRADSLSISGGTVKVLPNGTASGVSYLKSLSIDQANKNNKAALDLTNNDLVVEYSGFSPFAAIKAMVLSGYAQKVDPTKTGIISSTSQADFGKEILVIFDNAVANAPQWPPGSGHTISPNSVIGKYTYFGDVNLDGRVTGDDYGTIDANMNTTPDGRAAWMRGDANMDGKVTGDDYGTIDATLGDGVGVSLSSAGSPVPEPGAIGALAAMTFCAARRRRKPGI